MREIICIFVSVYAAYMFPVICHRSIIFLRVSLPILDRRRATRIKLPCKNVVVQREMEYAFLKKE